MVAVTVQWWNTLNVFGSVRCMEQHVAVDCYKHEKTYVTYAETKLSIQKDLSRDQN